MQLNRINCEFTDSESDTENAISINMINVESDYEPNIYEQPIYSDICQNHDQFLLNYYTRPISNNTTKGEKIVEEITEEIPQNAQAQITFIKTYLKNNNYKTKKYGQSHFFEKVQNPNNCKHQILK